MIKIIKYLVESILLIVSALPVLLPKCFHYFERDIAKYILIGSAVVLAISILDDIVAYKENKALIARVAATEKAAIPIPLPTRLRDLLREIDPQIMPAFMKGQRRFEGGISTSQFTRLQTIANEKGAREFIIIDPGSVRMGIGMGSEGITYNIAFILDPKLLQQSE